MLFARKVTAANVLTDTEAKGRCEMNNRSNETVDNSVETIESLRDELSACQRELAECRKRIDEANRSCEAEADKRQCLLATLEAAQIGLWEGEIKNFALAEQWSPRFREIFGVSLDAHVSQELFLKCLHPEDREKIERAVMEAVSGVNGGKYRAEYRVVRPTDGSVRWVKASGQAFMSREGKVDRLIGAVLDVTAGKLLEEENVRLQEEFRDLFDEAPIPYVHEGFDTRFIRVNRAALNVLGIKAEEVRETFGSSFAVDNPENQKRLHDALTFVEGTGRECGPVLFELRRKDNGNPVWIHWWSKPARGGGYTRTMFLDVTDWVLMEQAKAALELTLESGQVGEWDLDLERGTSRRSLRHDQCFGYSQPIPQSEWGMDPFLNHVHPDDRARVEAEFRQAVDASDYWKSEFRVVWPDRSEHWLAARGRVDRVTSVPAKRMRGLITDVTERKKAEEKLRETKAVLEFTMESAEVGDWDLDLIHDTSRRSLRHDQCFGYSTPIPEAKWGIEEFIRHVHPDDRARVEGSLRGAVQDQSDWSAEFRVVWPDGSLHWLAAKGSSYRKQDGKATRMLGIVMDITERKWAEEALRASEQLARGQMEALKDSLEALAREPSPERLVEHIMRAITRRWGADSSSFWRRDTVKDMVCFEFAFEGDRVVPKDEPRFTGMDLRLPMEDLWPWPEVFRTGKPSLIEDIRTVRPFALRDRLLPLGIITVLLIPMSVGGRLEGAIGLRFSRKQAFRDDEIELAQTLANQAMLAMELARLSAESRESAVNAERNRLARDIHDTLAQGFTGVIVQLEAAKGAAVQNDFAMVAERMEQASDLARSSLGEARRSIHALRPRSLCDGTLFSALDGLLRRMSEGTNLSANLRVEGEPRTIDTAWEDALLRVAQESLTNTIKHACARNFRVTLSYRFADIQLRLADDGHGFQLGGDTDGFGLIGMKERVTQIGGQFILRSEPGVGVEILVTLATTKDLNTDLPNAST